MNPQSELVQLVLSTFTANTHLHDYVCLHSQFGFQCMLSLVKFINTHVLAWFRILCWFM